MDLHPRGRKGSETRQSIGDPDHSARQGEEPSPAVRPEVDILFRRETA